MAKIIKVSSLWDEETLSDATEKVNEIMDEKCILVADSEMQVFEYDEIEEVTVNYDEVLEEIKEIDSEKGQFIDSDELMAK